ncbi:MAG TPA: peroxiredoxin family protein [Acidobacteriaceae bacterium]|nr:peroxiredoxin family protein [Acidobacteriaceae bacterium]
MIFPRNMMRLAKLSGLCLLLPALAGALHAQTFTKIPGLTVGDKIPSISAKDQTGTPQTFDTLKGKRGLLLLFSRSADWCPFCKQQLLELQQAKQAFEAKGIHVVSITYDSQAILKSFADRKGITYPMLSDPQSKIIRAFGILNPDGKGFAAGIPYPGMYFITPDGVIRKRFFEAQYYDRFTPNDAYAEIFGGLVPAVHPFLIRHGRHVTVQLAQSDNVVGPGSRFELLLTIHPASKVHVYAPGAETYGYKVVKLTLNASPDFQPLPTDYPQGTIMNFPILKESVPVYNKPTVIRQDVVMSATHEFVHSVGQGKQVEVTGTLNYQACNDHECFNPVTQPVKWTLHVIPLDTVRAPEAIRHK